jgi:hypothetical protein
LGCHPVLTWDGIFDTVLGVEAKAREFFVLANFFSVKKKMSFKDRYDSSSRYDDDHSRSRFVFMKFHLMFWPFQEEFCFDFPSLLTFFLLSSQQPLFKQ